MFVGLETQASIQILFVGNGRHIQSVVQDSVVSSALGASTIIQVRRECVCCTAPFPALCVHMCVCKYMYAYVCMDICMHIHTYIYTHTHTYLHA